MQYCLTKEQEEIRENVRLLAKNEIKPGAARRDAEGVFDWEIVELLAEQGLFGADFDEAYGGTGFGLLAQILVIKELAKVDAACALLPAVQELASLPIRLAGNKEQKERWLTKLATGECLGAFALTEPGAGSDVARLKCRAVKDGDYYVINGTKTFISNGSVAKILPVYAITDPNIPAYKGSSVLVVEKDTPGFSVGKKEKKMGIRWSDTVELVFEDCRVPAANLLGQEGHGFKIMMKSLDFSRLCIAAQALGIAIGAMELAVDYATKREAFGKTIIQYQGVSFKLADMDMWTEAARQLLYKTCALYQAQPKDMSKLSDYLVSMSAKTKCFCSDVAMKGTIEAVQVLGGYGYIEEYEVERMMRDAKITQIYEGTNEIMRDIIAKKLMAKFTEK